MSKRFLEFLYGLPPSGVPDNPLESAFAHLFEEAAAEEDLQMDTSKAPLVKALSAIGIEGGDIDEHPGWCDFHTDCADKYREAVKLLADYDNVYKLAQAGWVATLGGDAAMSNEPPEFHIHFLEIGEAETSDAEKAEKIKTITKDAREFATTELDRDDDNPVEAPDIGTKLAKTKGIGQAADGAAPEGTPKGSTKSESLIKLKWNQQINVNEAGLATGKCKNCGKNGLNCECDEPDFDYTYASGGKEYKGREHRPGKDDVTVTEGAHKAGCQCGFCKNKGRFGKKDKPEDGASEKDDQSDKVTFAKSESAFDVQEGKLSKSKYAQITREHDANTVRLNKQAAKAGIKCTCGAASYGEKASHSSVCAIFKKFYGKDWRPPWKKESAAQVAASLLEDDLTECEPPEGKTPCLAKKPAAKSLPGRPKMLPKKVRLKESREPQPQYRIGWKFGKQKDQPRECPCPDCGGPGRRTGPERFKCRRCSKQYTRKKKTTEGFTGVSAIPPLEMGIKGDGLETKGRGGKKLGRKFKMPRQWHQKRPITRLP